MTFDGAPTMVLNHLSFFDIMILLAKLPVKPGFIAKWGMRQIPGIGYYADVILNSLFVRREDSKSKHSVLGQV